jgi:hypothetical protein
MKRTLTFVALLVFMAFTTEAVAGWVIQLKYTNSDGEVNYETLEIQDNKLRSTGTDGTFIFDLAGDRMIVIDDKSQTYWQVKISEIRETYFQASKKFIEEMLNNMPEQEREMYRSLFKEMENMYAEIDKTKVKAINIKVDKTGNSEEIAGFRAEEYLILVDDEIIERKWLAKGLDVSSDMNMRKMAESFKEISPVVGEEALYEYTDTYLSLHEKGFEVRSVTKDGDQIEVTSAEKQRIDGSLFKIPEGFKQITIEDMMRMEMTRDNDDND